MVTAQELFDALDDASLSGEVTGPKAYSGRGMYGKQCIAVSLEYGGEWEVARALFKRLPNFDELPSPHTDSMGRGTVLYWPSMEWNPEWRDSEDWA